MSNESLEIRKKKRKLNIEAMLILAISLKGKDIFLVSHFDPKGSLYGENWLPFGYEHQIRSETKPQRPLHLSNLPRNVEIYLQTQ